MNRNVLTCCLKQFSHRLLSKSDGFIFEPDIDFGLSAFGLINYYLRIIHALCWVKPFLSIC